MAVLTARARKSLPKKDFAGPGRSFPVEDKSHAKNAKARASEMEHKGRISKSEEKRIDAKADRELDKPKRSERDKDRQADRVVARMSRPKPVR